MDKKLLNKVMKKLAFLECSDKSDSEEFISLIINAERTGRKRNKYSKNWNNICWNQFPLQRADGTNGILQKRDDDTPIYKVITQRTLNSLCLEARARHINCWGEGCKPARKLGTDAGLSSVSLLI